MKIGPQKGKQEKAFRAIAEDKADIVFYGGAAGSGKSHLLLLINLLFKDDPNYNAIIFRRLSTHLDGGIWDEAKQLYTLKGLDAKPKESSPKRLRFPSGAQIIFSHMELERNKTDHQGKQYSGIFWDELTQFEETQFTYLITRMRSKAKNSSFMFATMNPDPDSWVLKWVDWYLDEEGYPDQEKDGVIRWMYLINNEPVFANTKEELEERYPSQAWVYNPQKKTKVYVPPKRFMFISGNIFDNPALIESEPQYLASLQNSPAIERARLLEGNWYVRPKGSNYFDREWLKKTDKLPLNAKCCRAWDKASSEPSEKEKYPDYTACSPRIYKDKDGFFYLVGDFAESTKDSEAVVYGRFRKRPGERDVLIRKQAEHDGADCIVVLPKDPSSAGAFEFQESAKKLIHAGFIVKKDPMPSNTSKLSRFSLFSSAAQNGLVYILENTFPNTDTLNAYLTELESFEGTRSTRAKKDDWVDATASAFNYLSKEKVIPQFALPEGGGASLVKRELG